MWHQVSVRAVWLLAASLLLLVVSACSEKSEGTVEGVVLNSAGKPVGGVRVFNSGDAPQTIETHSDAAGHFRLTGFDVKARPVYVFAEKPDYRFTGLRTMAGTTGVEVKMLLQTEPIPSRPVAAELMPFDQQQALARKMLERFRAEDSRGKQYYGVPIAMSRIDPELALRWAVESTDSGCLGLIRFAMAEKIADDDLDEAMSLLAPGSPERLNLLVKLGHRYTVSDPAKAMQCAEELVLGARAFDLPWRAGYLAEAGSIAIQLGNKDAGTKLLDEAGEMAARFSSEHVNAGARGMVAVAMAPSDLKRALDLLEPITAEDSPDRFRADIAVAICLEKLEQALEIAAKTGTGYNADRVRLRIAYRLAPTRPADAIRVVDRIPCGPQIDSGNVRKAMALGWVAVAIASRDKALACSLIDRAFAILMVPDTSESSSGTYGGWSSRAAFLAVQAQRIGYPDMESIIYRVLACRPARKNDSFSTGTVESEVFMAAFLGLIDPQAARSILESIEPQYKTIIANSCEVNRALWVKAWSVVDAKRGQTLFDAEVASIAGTNETDSEFFELVEAAELVAAPMHEKVHCINSHPDFRPPEQER